MNKLTNKRILLLGPVIFVASAIIAAVAPANKKTFSKNGILQASDHLGDLTCKEAVTGTPNCDFTQTDDELSFTTVAPGVSSDDGVTTGPGNTGLINHGNGIRVTT